MGIDLGVPGPADRVVPDETGLHRRDVLMAGLAFVGMTASAVSAKSSRPALTMSFRDRRGAFRVAIWGEGGSYLAEVRRGRQSGRYRLRAREADLTAVARGLTAGPGHVTLSRRGFDLAIVGSGERARLRLSDRADTVDGAVRVSAFGALGTAAMSLSMAIVMVVAAVAAAVVVVGTAETARAEAGESTVDVSVEEEGDAGGQSGG